MVVNSNRIYFAITILFISTIVRISSDFFDVKSQIYVFYALSPNFLSSINFPNLILLLLNLIIDLFILAGLLHQK